MDINNFAVGLVRSQRRIYGLMHIQLGGGTFFKWKKALIPSE